ncbi:MAG: lysine 2,3-aminomutase [Acidobacteriota bacterium]|nr:lysine 2,3-aminomutase [Acidobacteriota bacterium]
MTTPLSLAPSSPPSQRFQAVTRRNVHRLPQWSSLPEPLREAVDVVARVLPFRSNRYVVEHLIDWQRVPEDPLFQLTFPQPGMLEPQDFQRIRRLLHQGAGPREVEAAAQEIRQRLNPQPAGQLSHNVPTLDGRRLQGLQHKYRETVLFFPAAGQTCHAYCTYCFRWAQFVGPAEMRFGGREVEDLVSYLRLHPEVTDVLITGGDAMILKARLLRRIVEPLLAPELEHVQNIRFGTKALAYWPQRFVTDEDADDLLRLLEEIEAAGRHGAIMAHASHPVELQPSIARRAISRLRGTGAQIRMQAPVVRRVNDAPEPWAELWREGVQLGMVPYYLFIERDTGPKRYFEVPLARTLEIFQQAHRRVSGLARTVRGPVMSAFPGKVRIAGVETIHGERAFVLEMLQGRSPDWAGRTFFARYDPHATWLDQLQPAFGEECFFFETEGVSPGAGPPPPTRLRSL